MRQFFLAAMIVLAAAACGANPQSSAATAAHKSTLGIGNPLPPLSLRRLDGGQWSAESTRGSVLLLDFWATYCKPCRKAFPKLNRLQANYPEVSIVGVSVDEEDAVVRAYLAEVKASFAIVRDPALTVKSGPLQVTSLPTLIVVDQRGIVRHRFEEMKVDDYDQLEGIVAGLLAPSSPTAAAEARADD